MIKYNLKNRSNMRTKLFVASVLLIANTAFSNEAVSEANGKIDSAYGNLNSSEGWITEGSFSLPVKDAFGFQIDGIYADIEDVDFEGFGGHFFWRDHEKKRKKGHVVMFIIFDFLHPVSSMLALRVRG